MTQADQIAQAERLMERGSSDERIESLTELSLADILALRARLATRQRSRRADYFPGRSWWRGPTPG